MLVAGWPSILRGAGALRVRAVAAPTRLDPAASGRLEVRIQDSLEAAEAGDLLVISLVGVKVGIEAIELVARHWDRSRRLPPEGEVGFAVTFLTGGWGGHARDLRFLWDRSWARAAVRPLALMLSQGLGEGALSISGPFRGATADYIRWLPELPVVSAEIVSRLGAGTGTAEVESAPNYRWSNRIAALRRAGLIVPLGRTEELGDLRKAHAEAVGRPIDKRPTRLYRSVPYDLKRWADYALSEME